MFNSINEPSFYEETVNNEMDFDFGLLNETKNRNQKGGLSCDKMDDTSF